MTQPELLGRARTPAAWWVGALAGLVGGVLVGVLILVVYPIWFLTVPLWLLAVAACAVTGFVLASRFPRLLVLAVMALGSVPVTLVTIVGYIVLQAVAAP